MVFRCKMCGAPLEVDGTQSVVVCEYCECSQTVQLPPEPKKKEESSNYFKEAREEKERKEREETEKRNLEKEREEQEKKKREREQEEYEKRKREEEQEEYERRKREEEQEEREQEKHEEDDDHEQNETGGGCVLWFKAIIRGFILLMIGAYACGTILRSLDYREAMELKKNGEYEEALQLFLEVSNHKDAVEQAEEILTILRSEEAERREEILASGEYDYLKEAEVGDVITLGTYEKVRVNGTKNEPIQWLVLGKEDGKILVLSDNFVDTVRMGERVETWEDNPAREWLHSNFYEKAFTEEEKTLIYDVINDTSNYCGGGDEKTIDSVFLLSIEEVEKYMQKDQEGTSEKTSIDVGRIWSAWLLRNPVERHDDNGRGLSSKYMYFTIQVLSSGEVDYFVDTKEGSEVALRPAMWLALE